MRPPCEQPAYAQAMMAEGFRFFIVSSDLRMMASKAREVLGSLKGVRSGEPQRTKTRASRHPEESEHIGCPCFGQSRPEKNQVTEYL